jgi:hypothetical protein
MNEAEDHGTSASAYWAVELPAAADRALAMLAPRPLSGALVQEKLVETPPCRRTGSLPRPRRTTPPPALGPSDLERGWSFYFSNEPTAEFGYYGSGFLEAARTLARSFARRRGGRQVDILPVLFLYRHSIELLAKAVILSGNQLMQQGGAAQDERDLFDSFGHSRHRLLPLLDSIRQVFEYAHWEWQWPESAVESFDDARRVIEELDALDPDSCNFRYPTTIRGERAIPPGHMMGRRTILAVLDDLAESLDTAVFGLDAECGRAQAVHDDA